MFLTLLWMDIQVRRAGGLRGVSVFDIRYGRLMPSEYREIAKTGRLPMWPLHFHLVSLFGTIIFAGLLMYTLKK